MARAIEKAALLAVLLATTAAVSAAGSPLSVTATPDVAPFATALSTPAKPGNPPNVAQNYATLLEKFFDPHPDMWGGAFVDGDVLVVNAVGYPVDQAVALLADAGVTQGIRVVASTRSIAQLEKLTDEAASLYADNIVSVGPQYATSTVAVGVRSNDISQRTALAAIDPSAFTVYQTAPASTTSRYWDTSPFYGGAEIVLTGSGSGSGVCTSGFAWNAPSGSTKYFVTAGHCYAENNGTRATVNRVSTSNAWLPIGSITWSSMNNNGTMSSRHGDLAVYALSGSNGSSNRIYVGTYNTSSSRAIIGSKVLPEGWQGSDVYTSGTGPSLGNGTGEVNLDWISLVNQTVTYTNTSPHQVVKNLTVGENATTCTGGGDSGGAVYQQSGTADAYAMGIISGNNGQGVGLTNCRNYFTPIGYVSSDFGGSLKTS
jgi:hypothetical protein